MSFKVDARGRFGDFGGCYVSEILMRAVAELNEAYEQLVPEEQFAQSLDGLLSEYAGRPTPLTRAENLSAQLGCQIYLKREDLLHTGAHKLNNALGQALLAKQMGKRRLIAETGAGQHGVAVATAAAKLGLEADIYMGAVDIERQRPNLLRMELLGARVVAVESGSATLKDAINEALRDWASSSDHTHYLIGSVLGPHPYPDLVAHFQSVIGHEAKRQIEQATGRLPSAVVACVGGGSNAIGIFRAFLDEPNVKLYGVEAGGIGISDSSEHPKHAARFADGSYGRPGVLHGSYTQLLQDAYGQILPTESIAAGLDYPAVGPEHAHLRKQGRVHYTYATDQEALRAFRQLSRQEGIIPALESSHALAFVEELASGCSKSDTLLVNLSGRGDKDLLSINEWRKGGNSNGSL